MPYELGIDVGCIEFGKPRQRDKKILILEKERHHYKVILSDITGQDIENHGDDPETIVRKVHNWIFRVIPEVPVNSANAIWSAYIQFNDDLRKQLGNQHFSAADIDEMPFSEYIKFVNEWLNNFKGIDVKN